MPVFINEVTAEIPQAPVEANESHAPQEQVSTSPREYDLLTTLNLIEERRQRLEFD